MAKLQMDANEKKNPTTQEDFRKYAESIFRCAEEYATLAIAPFPYLFDKAITAITTNMAFACELYLKALLVMEQKKTVSGHKIDELFRSIQSDEIKNRIQKRVGYDNFDLCIQEIKLAFTVTRYTYEYKQMAWDFKFLNLLMIALRDECKIQMEGSNNA